MDIWATRCVKRCRCYYCGEDIIKGTPMVKGKSWRKHTDKGGEVKKWCRTFRWHPNCWMEQAVKSVENSPERKMGRKSLDLTEEQKKVRYRLLHRYAFITFQQRKSGMKEHPDLARILKLEVFRQQIIEEIKDYGGVPPKWTVGDGVQPPNV